MADQFRLITDAQNVPTETVTDEDGTTRTVYGQTVASEAALTQLYTAFLPAIRNAARQTSQANGTDDALMVATEAFFLAIRAFDLTTESALHHSISAILVRAVKRADQISDVVAIPATPVKRYWRLVNDHDGDVKAAYEAAGADRDDTTRLSKAGFLAVHRVMSGVKDVDGLDVTDVADGNQPDAAYLLSLVTPRQETALRLRFGFDDNDTEALRERHEHKLGSQIPDVDLVPILNATFPALPQVSRQKVQRERTAALATMRDAWTEEINGY
ncbi:hypothetical protein [Kribbella sp. CA-293567]|uniref:hypothetical protein n=1 Tax=Kribbella sp. CA-293567 TaxID=3002436 RepID=UPI0022DE0B88|nr:hypothetical protein [Kribbella sp. CA-293567]WBQ03815.1 hypothetical protein OX958_28075 [Kribbella sp. CA-293567]